MSNNSIDFIKNTFLNLIENFESIFSSFDQVATSYHFIILALLILFSGFFSAAEIAIFHVKEYQIQDEKGKLLKKKYRFLYKLVARKEIILSTILIGNNIANVFASILEAIFLPKLFSWGMAKEFAVSLSSFFFVLGFFFVLNLNHPFLFGSG